MVKRSNVVLDDNILLFQILPKLPAMSLGRFKCVCKQWRSFLTTPVFTKMHLHHVNDQNHHRLLVVPTTNPCRYFRTIDCETPEVGLSASRSLPFEANSNDMSIMSSLNGLVCVRIHRGWYRDIVLWNPLTGDYKTLSKDNSHVITYGLYYSYCDDDYKLLRVTESSNAYIYSLKSDSWRKVESPSCPPLEYLISSCLLNENLYFLERSRYKMQLWSYSILRFNTNTEKFTEIAAPSLRDVGKCYFRLTVVSGCVYLCASSKEHSWDKLDLWKMEKDGEWTKVVGCCHRLSKREFYRPLHLMKNGNWLVGPRGKKAYAYEVDLAVKTTKEVWRYTPTPTDDPMKILWGGKFVETIVLISR